MPLNETKQIFSKDFEHHADMRAIWPLVFKVVKKGYNVGPARMSLRRGRCRVRILRSGLNRRCGRGDETLQELDFVESSFRIPWSGFNYFEGDMTIQPDYWMK